MVPWSPPIDVAVASIVALDSYQLLDINHFYYQFFLVTFSKAWAWIEYFLVQTDFKFQIRKKQEREMRWDVMRRREAQN